MSYVIQDSVLKFKDPMKPPNSIIYTYENFENLGAMLYQKVAKEKKPINFASTNILLNLYSKTGSHKNAQGAYLKNCPSGIKWWLYQLAFNCVTNDPKI